MESEETCQERHIGFRSIEARKSSAGKAELLAEITRLENHNRAIRIHWQEEVEEFARKEAKQKSKETQLLAEIQHLRDARHQREYAGVEDLEGQLYQERQNAWNWQSKVQEIQNMKLFIDDHCPRPKPLELEIIEDAVNIIGTGIQSLLHRCDAGTSEHIPLIRRNSDLESLFRSLVPTKLSIGQMQRLVPKQIAKWGLPIAIRGLTTAALKDWVFESDFPNFSRNGDPRMLEEYRSIILNFGK